MRYPEFFWKMVVLWSDYFVKFSWIFQFSSCGCLDNFLCRILGYRLGQAQWKSYTAIMGLFFIQDGCFSFILQSFFLGILGKHFKLFGLRVVVNRNSLKFLLWRTPEERNFQQNWMHYFLLSGLILNKWIILSKSLLIYKFLLPHLLGLFIFKYVFCFASLD